MVCSSLAGRQIKGCGISTIWECPTKTKSMPKLSLGRGYGGRTAWGSNKLWWVGRLGNLRKNKVGTPTWWGGTKPQS